MERSLVVVLIALGALLLLVLASAPPPSPSTPAPARQEELLASGRFLSLEEGVPTAVEDYTLLYSPQEGYLLLSQATLLGAPPVDLAQQCQLDRGFKLFLYQLAATTPAGTQVISAQIGLSGLEMEVRVGTARRSAIVPGAGPIALLDTHLVSHYVLLALAAEAGAFDGTLTVIVPQDLLILPASLAPPVPTSFRSGDVIYAATSYALHVAEGESWLLVHEGRLVGVAAPAGGGWAYDVARFPDGAEWTPPADPAGGG